MGPVGCLLCQSVPALAPVHQPVPSRMAERVHVFAAHRQAAGVREGPAAGGAGVGAVAGLGVQMDHQVVGS